MADSESAPSNGFQSAQSAECTDAALEQCGGDPLRLPEQAAWFGSRQPKLGARKMLWILVLTLLITIGALVIAIGLFSILLQLLPHEVAGI
jgi:hypothetical protein